MQRDHSKEAELNDASPGMNIWRDRMSIHAHRLSTKPGMNVLWDRPYVRAHRLPTKPGMNLWRGRVRIHAHRLSTKSSPEKGFCVIFEAHV